MTHARCTLAECSVGVTGTCVLSHSPASSCPNFLIESRDTDDAAAAIPRREWKTRTLSPGNELGLQQLDGLMARRYATLVGLLGEASTGKTCLLSSLYLLASCGQLTPSLVFGGSSTVLGFEQRLRKFREWAKAGLPDKIMERTILADPRRPGFVHLAFRDTKSTATHDLVFSDLPGEWTTDLMKRAATAPRFTFLQRADALVIAITAPSLLELSTRHNQVQNVRVLLQRLRDTVGVEQSIPLIFALTRCDVSGPHLPSPAYELAAIAEGFGYRATFQIALAAFSQRDDVPSGLGLGEMLDAIIESKPHPRQPSADPQLHSHRMFAHYLGPV